MKKYAVPTDGRFPSDCLSKLILHLEKAQDDISGTLNNGLSAEHNLTLFSTTDAAEATSLIILGLQSKFRSATETELDPE